MELSDMGGGRPTASLTSTDGCLSSQLLEAMRREIARHVEHVYSQEIATLKRRVDELESAMRDSPGMVEQAGMQPKSNLPRPLASRKGTGGSMSSEGRLQTPASELARRKGTGVSVSSDQPGPNSMRTHRGNTEDLVLINGRMVFKYEIEDEEAAADCLPESLFNYCVERFAVSQRSWCDPAVGYLVLLTLTQNLLMNGFSQMNFKAVIQQHWEPFDQRPKVLMDCIYADFRFMGEPVMFLLVVLVCLVIVALVIKSVTDNSLLVMFPDRGAKPGLWAFVNFVWFQQMVFIPAIFSVEAAALFSTSADTSALIMNTLAVTFILDVDKLLYDSLLDDSQKADYQALANNAGRPKRTRRTWRSSWILFWVALLQMCVQFFGIRVFLRESAGRDFINAMLPFYSTYVIGNGLRGAVQIWATRSEDVSWTSLPVVASFVLFAAAGPCWYFTIARFTLGTWTDAMYRSSCFDRSLCYSIEACN